MVNKTVMRFLQMRTYRLCADGLHVRAGPQRRLLPGAPVQCRSEDVR